MAEKRKLGSEFKREALKLITERAVAAPLSSMKHNPACERMGRKF